MSDFEELSFVIPGYTPDTMPLDRLIEYLQQMAVVLGDPTNLHLIEIRKSSVNPVLHAPKSTALEARDRAFRVQRGEGTQRQNDAYNRIRRMVRRDAAGSKHAGRPALLKSSDRIILEIPAAPEDSGVIEGLRQATHIDGQLIKVGGAGEDAALQLQSFEGRIQSGLIAKRHLAKELAQLLWGPTVRLHGIGLWSRDAEGTWSLSRMQVHSFEQLDDDDLMTTIERLRSLNVEWPENVLELLRLEREGDQ